MRGRDVIPSSSSRPALRPSVVLVITLVTLLFLTVACVQDTGAVATQADTSPLAAATSAPIEGEPALTDSSTPTTAIIGEPEIAVAPTQPATEEPIAEEPTATSPLTATAAVPSTADLSALLEQPIATESPATEPPAAEPPTTEPPAAEAATGEPTVAHHGALSGASSTLAPTVAAGGAIMARLAAMNSAATATAEAAATSAPDDAAISESTDAVPSIEPAPAVAPPPTPPTDAGAALTWDGVERTVDVPILMYHYLSDPPTNADAIRRDLSVSPQRFAEHLDRLQQEGYTTISLYTLVAALNTGAPLPKKPVVITFDDSYRDNYDNAFPLLHDRGMTATFFVITDFIDEERPDYLSWDQVREMLAGGMSIESHGRNHATLEGRNDDYLVWQALGSLETLQFELGVRPRFVSYPAGDYDANTERIFASAGYLAGVTTEPGATQRSDNPFELPRVRIHSTTTADQLSVLLAMDWD